MLLSNPFYFKQWCWCSDESSWMDFSVTSFWVDNCGFEVVHYPHTEGISHPRFHYWDFSITWGSEQEIKKTVLYFSIPLRKDGDSVQPVVAHGWWKHLFHCEATKTPSYLLRQGCLFTLWTGGKKIAHRWADCILKWDTESLLLL